MVLAPARRSRPLRGTLEGGHRGACSLVLLELPAVAAPGSVVTPHELDVYEAQVRARPKTEWTARVDELAGDGWTRWFLRERLRIEASDGCSFAWGNPTDAHRCVLTTGHTKRDGTSHQCACGLRERAAGRRGSPTQLLPRDGTAVTGPLS